MFEKVNPSHPDKVADRIAGALVDYAYSISEKPIIAVEVLLGHGVANIIIESNIYIPEKFIEDTVIRIANIYITKSVQVSQDTHLADNQETQIRCGDNGIFKGSCISDEEQFLTNLAGLIYKETPFDGKYLINNDNITICQSHTESLNITDTSHNYIVNPLGPWTGGPDVDCGATNRKLGSDMGRGVTGGGLHGKDLSKADVTLNIYCFLKAQEIEKDYELCCSIGDTEIDGKNYKDLVDIARSYINSIGGFEKFAEWGLIRPNVDIE